MIPPTQPWPSIGSPDRAHVRVAIGLMLLVDAFLVAKLGHAPLLLAAAVAGAALVLLARDLPVALAMVAVGAPLLDPLNEALRDERPVTLGLRLALLLAMAWTLFARVPRSGRWGLRTLADPATGFALAMLALLMVGSLETASPAYARAKIVGYLTTNLLFFMAGALLAAPEVQGGAGARDRAIDRFSRAALILAAVIAGVALLNIPFRFYRYEARLRTLGINPIWLGRTMGLALLILGGQALAGATGKRLLAVVGLVLAAVLLLTGSRGPILGLVLTVAIVAGLMPRFSSAARARVALGVVVVAAAAVLLMPPELSDRFLKPGVDVSDVTRVRLVQIVVDALAETPWTGIGTGGFSQLLRMGDIRAYPHNLAAEVLIENGIVGLGVLAAFIGLGLARGLRGRGDPRGLMLLACVLFAVWNSMLSGDITSNEWVWLFCGILAGRARS